MKKTTKNWGMVALTIIMLSSSLTAFMGSAPQKSTIRLMIKFNAYESYKLEVPISQNSTLLSAISSQFAVKVQNQSICINNECDGNGKWLFFNENGFPISINSPVKSGNYYAIYNLTRNNALKDEEAIKNLLLNPQKPFK